VGWTESGREEREWGRGDDGKVGARKGGMGKKGKRRCHTYYFTINHFKFGKLVGSGQNYG